MSYLQKFRHIRIPSSQLVLDCDIQFHLSCHPQRDRDHLPFPRPQPRTCRVHHGGEHLRQRHFRPSRNGLVLRALALYQLRTTRSTAPISVNGNPNSQHSSIRAPYHSHITHPVGRGDDQDHRVTHVSNAMTLLYMLLLLLVTRFTGGTRCT